MYLVGRTVVRRRHRLLRAAVAVRAQAVGEYLGADSEENRSQLSRLTRKLAA